METERPANSNNTRNVALALAGLSIIFLVWAIYNQKKIGQINEAMQQLAGTNAIMLDSIRKENERVKVAFGNMTKTRDSLERILIPLQPYRPLVGMLLFRDSVQSSLPFKVGDKVLYVPDSSSAIVKEVRITGAGPAFGIDYVVVLKGGIEKSVPSILLEQRP
jgi:hypothetical protein